MSVSVHNGGLSPIDHGVYTAYCAFPDSPRGVYDEEIDLIEDRPRRRSGETAIRREAQAELDRNYEPGMKVRRIRRVW